MNTYHIHIKGQVQGVGFRPFVYQQAEKLAIKGWVSNSNDGVHIEFNASPGLAAQLYHNILTYPPTNAIITEHSIKEVSHLTFSSFTIKESIAGGKPNLLFTPDIAMCEDCKSEVLQQDNRWSRYPFTTCLHCGPRYSIITHLPYDREATTMAPLPPCNDCSLEYNNVLNRRYYSQTISCNHCAIPMHLYNANAEEIIHDNIDIIPTIISLLKDGKTVAVKGIGGYLLLCDAANALSISILRKRKHRPSKPFALLYPDVSRVKEDTEISRIELKALQEKSAPIVLCQFKANTQYKICTSLIAPGLNKIGIMLPYSPLLLLLSTSFGKPLIATSGNISGSPIVFKDEEALQQLKEVADYILTYDREIVVPQDDSVLQFTPVGQKIILRRSRGLSPNYNPNPFIYTRETVLAMGAELKAAFALLSHPNLYVSQFLGDQECIESQEAYKKTVHHLMRLLQTNAKQILIDSHPGYYVSFLGKELSVSLKAPITPIQHHKAHFGAVLAENNLLYTTEPVLGVIWDGNGYGEDEQIWGGEFFIFKQNEMQRIAHLDYFTHLLGDKMSKEPRLSALSLVKDLPAHQKVIKRHFSENEWQYFGKLLQQPGQLQSSSMGRFIDGVASILGICQVNTYEGEAGMKLEAAASNYRLHALEFYPLPFVNSRLQYNAFLPYIFEDLEKNADVSFIAWKVFCSLAKSIEILSEECSVQKIAFSGGVFQNALLSELVIRLLSPKAELYFHHQLSPNDECIGFGQIACYEIAKRKPKVKQQRQKRKLSDQFKYHI